MLAEHDPAARLAVLVVDEPELAGSAAEPFEVLGPADLGLPAGEIRWRSENYGPQALTSSLKPALLRSRLQSGAPAALLLDADVAVYAPLGDLFEAAAEHGVVLTVHSHDPVPHGGDAEFKRAGVFNGGCLAVGPGALPFLDWWDERTARDCRFAPEQGLFLSQGWLALVPALFDHHIVRDAGINVMGHNLSGRDVEWRDGRPFIGAVPLRIFHFTGLDYPPGPGRLSRHDHLPWWPSLDDRPGVARLLEAYLLRLDAAQ